MEGTPNAIRLRHYRCAMDSTWTVYGRPLMGGQLTMHDSAHGRLSVNVASYGLLQIVQYIAPLLTLPVLTRALGVQGFGLLALAVLVGSYVNLLVDFGFNLTANREIATSRGDQESIRRIFWEVQTTRAVLAIVGCSATVIVALMLTHSYIAGPIVLATLGSAIGSLLLPVWYLEGRQQLREVAIALMAARFLQLGVVLTLVQNPADLWIAVTAEATVNLSAGLMLLPKQWKKIGPWMPVPCAAIFCRIKANVRLLAANVSVALYTSAHTLILALFAPPAAVGFFALADRAIAAGKGGLRPLASAMYPHLSSVASTDPASYRRQWRLHFAIFVGAGLTASGALFLLAEPAVLLLAGPGYERSAELLRWMSPIPLMVALSNIFGVQTLLVLGRERVFSNILICVAVVGASLSFVLASQNGAAGSAVAAVTSEMLATTLMAVAAWRAWEKMR